MGTFEVKLLQYVFVFHDLKWREEFSIKFGEKDRLRTILAHALDEVSGIKIESIADAHRVLDAIPSAVIYRIFVLYKGNLKTFRSFTTVGLWRAPEPSKVIKKIEEAEEEREHIMDRVEQEMIAKFGRKELAEARAMELEVLKASPKRNLVRATPDKGDA